MTVYQQLALFALSMLVLLAAWLGLLFRLRTEKRLADRLKGAARDAVDGDIYRDVAADEAEKIAENDRLADKWKAIKLTKRKRGPRNGC